MYLYIIGPLFEIPVTVVKPEVMVPNTLSYEFGVRSLASGERVRKFLVPPLGCTYIDAVIRDCRTIKDEDESIQSHPVADDKISNVPPEEEEDGRGIISADVGEELYGGGGTGVDGSGKQIVLHSIQLFRGTPYRDIEEKVRLINMLYALAYMEFVV